MDVIDLCDDDTPPQGTDQDDSANDRTVILIDENGEEVDKPSRKKRRKKDKDGSNEAIVFMDELPETAPVVFGFADREKTGKREKDSGTDNDFEAETESLFADKSKTKVEVDESSKSLMDLGGDGDKEATPRNASHDNDILKACKDAPFSLMAADRDGKEKEKNDSKEEKDKEEVYPSIMTSVDYSHEKVSAGATSGSSSHIGSSGYIGSSGDYIGPSSGNMNGTPHLTSPSLTLDTSMYLSNGGTGGLDDPSLDDASRDLIRQLSEENEVALAELEEQERLTMSLIRGEQSERQKELDNQRFKCWVCLDDDVKLEDMITLGCQPEAHRFCLDCFSGYCTDKIKDAIVAPDKLICPMSDCTYSISYIELKNNIPQDIFEKYETFTMRYYGEASDDCRFCPKCNEWFAEVPQTDEDEHIWKTVQCEKEECQEKFCGRCGQKPHKSQYDQDLTCEEYAAWQTANGKVDEDLEKYMKENKITRCPECNQGGELKSGNCKFAYCRCGVRFCYLCGVKLDERQHYSHFQGGKGDYLTGKKLTGPFGNGCLGPSDPQLAKNGGKGGKGGQAHVPGMPMVMPPLQRRPAGKMVAEPPNAKAQRRIEVMNARRRARHPRVRARQAPQVLHGGPANPNPQVIYGGPANPNPRVIYGSPAQLQVPAMPAGVHVLEDEPPPVQRRKRHRGK